MRLCGSFRNFQIVECLIFVFVSFQMISCAPARPAMASLKLKGPVRTQDTSRGYLEDYSGKQYDLSKVTPYDAFIVLNPRKRGTNDTLPIPVYIGNYHDGSSLLVEKDINGQVLYAELRKGSPKSITYFLKTQECQEHEIVFFASSELERTDLEDLSFGEDDGSENHVPTNEVESQKVQLPNHVYKRGDRTSSECLYFKVVKVGVIYDAEFCRKYGGTIGARSRIMLIVAAASLLFENDMCVKLQLVDIYTPDENCAATSTFASMRRDKACGSGAKSETFIRYFADWMNNNRDSIGLDPEAVFHAFTGFSPQGALGCAYIGTMCRLRDFAYGVNYMDSNFLSDQSIVFAHELAHNLNARHLTPDEAGTDRYVMMPTLQNPTIGFSSLTIQRILEYLDLSDVACDSVMFPAVTNTPTQIPSPLPTVVPSPEPSVRITKTPFTSSPINPTQKCGLESLQDDPLCFTSSTDGHFGCMELSNLINVQPNNFCLLENPVISRVAFRSCLEEEEEEGKKLQEETSNQDTSNDKSRFLRPKTEKTQKDVVANDPMDDNDWILESTEALLYEGSNDRGLDFFQADDCTRTTCTTVGNHVCFATYLSDGQEERIFVVTFFASVGQKSDLITVRVSVQRDDVRNTFICHSAQSKCFDK